MTLDGQLYELPTWARLTTETAGSAWPHLPTPTAADADRGPDYAKATRPGAGGDDLVTAIARLFPLEKADKYFKTPTANLGSNGAPQHPDKRKAGGHGPTLEDEVCFLLSVDAGEEEPTGDHSPEEWWGDFAKVVHRWEALRGIPAPVPIIRGPRGGLKLAPKFSEWLMGPPPGWVTAVPDLSDKDQMRRLGNGAVPQQAEAAFRLLLSID